MLFGSAELYQSGSHPEIAQKGEEQDQGQRRLELSHRRGRQKFEKSQGYGELHGD